MDLCLAICWTLPAVVDAISCNAKMISAEGVSEMKNFKLVMYICVYAYCVVVYAVKKSNCKSEPVRRPTRQSAKL